MGGAAATSLRVCATAVYTPALAGIQPPNA